MRITQAVQSSIETNQLCSRAVIQCDALTQESDAAPSGHVTERLTQHTAVACSGEHQPHGDVDGRGLSGTVGTEEAEYFTLFHAERKLPERGHPITVEEAAVLLADGIELEGRTGHEALRIAGSRRIAKIGAYFKFQILNFKSQQKSLRRSEGSFVKHPITVCG
jgi:hypothetical protein